MNEKQIEELFRAARAESPPDPAANLELNVMRAIRSHSAGQEPSLVEIFASLAPRLAAGAGLMLALCVAADFCLSNFVQPDLSSGLNQLAEQWLFAAP